jgi:carboxyl-terminal processing protease
LKAGDVIEAIESQTTRDMSAAEIELALAGEKGSKVTISIIRPRNPKPEKVEIIRDNVALPSTLEKVIEGNIGYLDPGTLTKGKADELTAKIKAAEAAGAKKLILDLRNVSDGDPQEGIAVANLFLDHGTITYLQGQKFPRKDFNADPQKMITKLPLVVLINRGTANAAEIVAAAILENGRGDVVGDKSFGLGSVQKLIETPDGSALILSVAKYYTPSGKAIQDQAVTPNIVVADADQGFVSEDDDEGPAPEPQTNANPQTQPDEQLQRAITVLKNKSS